MVSSGAIVVIVVVLVIASLAGRPRRRIVRLRRTDSGTDYWAAGGTSCEGCGGGGST